MEEEGWKLRDVTRPPDGTRVGGPPRATLSNYLQDGVWLRTLPRPQTRQQLAAAVGVDVAEITEAAVKSMAGNQGRAAEPALPVGRGAHDGVVLPLDGMTEEQMAEVRRYAEYIRSQNPAAR